MIQKAKDLATILHEGQKRKEGTHYITHPAGVVDILKQEGINNEKILSVAWLHDTLEDTIISYKKLTNEFGKNVSDKVYLLSRNVDRDKYKTRIENSSYTVQIVKLADTLHNVHDPYSLNYLSEKGIQRKIYDCREFYIPLAKKICPSIGNKLEESIDNYLKIFGGKKNE
ncbi:MAG: HD domain-containing protein [Nanoarchaeota archaeon]|nr:HD domain-containing protein [Nanoarchaeota archaeon]